MDFLFKNSDLVGNIAHKRNFSKQLIDGHKHRHAFGRACSSTNWKIRQECCERLAVLYAPCEFRTAALDGFFLNRFATAGFMISTSTAAFGNRLKSLPKIRLTSASDRVHGQSSMTSAGTSCSCNLPPQSSMADIAICEIAAPAFRQKPRIVHGLRQVQVASNL